MHQYVRAFGIRGIVTQILQHNIAKRFVNSNNILYLQSLYEISDHYDFTRDVNCNK